MRMVCLVFKLFIILMFVVCVVWVNLELFVDVFFLIKEVVLSFFIVFLNKILFVMLFEEYLFIKILRFFLMMFLLFLLLILNMLY